jgi:hypothetical protein
MNNRRVPQNDIRNITGGLVTPAEAGVQEEH